MEHYLLYSKSTNLNVKKRFPGGSDGKESTCNAWVRSLGQEDPMEECKATHSSILAWRIPMDRGTWRAPHRNLGLPHRASPLMCP